MLHLKETEIRYNTKLQNQNLYKKLLLLIRENQIKVGGLEPKLFRKSHNDSVANQKLHFQIN